jgi:hypothetical protein
MEKRTVHRQTRPKRDPRQVVEFFMPLSLAVFSTFAGLLVTFSPVTAPFFYTDGIYFLFGILLVLFTGVSFYLALNKKKRHRVRPKDSVILQGRLFRLWFTSQNLAWAIGLNLFALVLLFFFGPQFEVMAVGAGALACTSFVLSGLIIAGESRTLGLCWQSSVPRSETNWVRFTGAAVFLRQRYENALREDQKKSEPVLWGISRVLERAGSGGADRPVDLMSSPATTRKSEFSYRAKVLVPIFIVTVLFSFFLRELPGLTPPHLLQFAREKSTGIFKKNKNIGQKTKESGEKSGKEFKEKGKRSEQDLKARKEESKKEFNQSLSDESNEELTDKDAAETRVENEKKEPPERSKDKSKDVSGEKSDSNPKAPDSDKTSGEKGNSQDSEKAKTDSRNSEDKTKGDSEKTARGEEGKETAGNSPGDREGSEKGESEKKGKSEGKGQEKGTEDGQGEEQGEGQKKADSQREGKGKEEGEGKGEGKSEEEADGQGKGEGEGEGEGKGKGEEQSKPGEKQGQQGSELSEGEGEGKSGQGPGLDSDTAVPIPPPGPSGMLEIDLPTVDRPEPADRPGAKKTDEKKDVGEAPISPDVSGQKKRGKAHPGSKAYKPEQYLPNWILALLNESKKNNH